jgi:hypothetical protein
MEYEVEITGMVTSSPWGSFSTGDIYRGDKAVCDHLVNQCGIAKYVIKAEPEPAKPVKANAKQG